jgi:hypothetical protein
MSYFVGRKLAVSFLHVHGNVDHKFIMQRVRRNLCAQALALGLDCKWHVTEDSLALQSKKCT